MPDIHRERCPASYFRPYVASQQFLADSQCQSLQIGRFLVKDKLTKIGAKVVRRGRHGIFRKTEPHYSTTSVPKKLPDRGPPTAATNSFGARWSSAASN